MPKKEPTKEEKIIEVMEELKNAFLEHEKAKKAEVDIKVRVQKSHKRLSMARDAMYSLEH